MNKTEIAKIITEEARDKGYSIMINSEMIEELKQASYMKQRNCEGMKMYTVQYTDMLLVLAVWSNGVKKLSIMRNVIMGAQ